MTGRTGRRRAGRGGEVADGIQRGVEQLSLLGGCLDERDRAVLAFAREHHWQGTVAEQVHQLGVSQTRYFQLLAPAPRAGRGRRGRARAR